MDPSTPAAVRLLSLLRYVDGDLDDDATYAAMSTEMGGGDRALFHLEVPPFLFGRIAEGIASAGRAKGARVMVEKPFGSDLESVQKLNQTMHRYFREDDIYRVDHWLGLDPLDAVLFARFANSVVEPLLNRSDRDPDLHQTTFRHSRGCFTSSAAFLVVGVASSWGEHAASAKHVCTWHPAHER